MKKILVILLAALSLSALSQTNNPSLLDKAKNYTARSSGDLFGKETVVDFGTTYTIEEPSGLRNVFQTDADHGVWGVSIAASQFPNKYVGFGFDVGIRDWNNIAPEVLDYAATTFTLRLPIDRYAISAVGAVGRDWDKGLYYFEAGPRLDVRWNRNIGVYAEARFTWRDAVADDTAVVRTGLSIAFP